MTVDDNYTRTLLVGGEAALAEALHTTPELVSKWLSGELRPPPRIYFAALDQVTKRTLGRRER